MHLVSPAKKDFLSLSHRSYTKFVGIFWWVFWLLVLCWGFFIIIALFGFCIVWFCCGGLVFLITIGIRNKTHNI